MAGHALSLAGAWLYLKALSLWPMPTGTPCATSVPLFVYSDNGGGETNKTLDADVTGIFSRLGIEHPTSIPGPQSRGIIERLNKGIPRRVAQFDTFSGDSADREHARITARAIQSASKRRRTAAN
jgi:transposase InsO family protein